MDTKYWTAKELNDQGVDWRAINKRLEKGTLFRVDRGLYINRPPRRRDVLLALQHRSPHLIFSGRTAAGVYGLGGIAMPATAWTTTNRRELSTDVLRTHRTQRSEHRVVEGVRVTTPLATAAAVVQRHPSGVLAGFISENYAGWRAKDNFTQDLHRLSPEERATLHEILPNTVIGASSGWERRTIATLRARGLEPIPNFKLGPYHWDMGFKHGSTVVDLDSRKYHGSDSRAFILDRWKTNYAVQEGWAALRFTDSCLEILPDLVFEQIEATISHRRATRGQKRAPKGVKGMLGAGIWHLHPMLAQRY